MTLSPDPDRTERERHFHDLWAQATRPEELLVLESFEAPTAVENRYALEQLGSLHGRRLLDIGCGAGESSVYFALQGAEVHACDVSEGFLKVAEQLASRFGTRIHTHPCEAAQLPFEDNFFDLVYGNGILHHVNLGPVGKEIQRVLKNEGTGVFIEPLPYNPVINIYRHMAKGVRTEDERPLTFSQIHEFGKLFSRSKHREFWFFALLIFFNFFLIRRWNPSKVRYWKKVIEEGKNYERMAKRLFGIDDKLLKAFPILGALCWNTVIVVRK